MVRRQARSNVDLRRSQCLPAIHASCQMVREPVANSRNVGWGGRRRRRIPPLNGRDVHGRPSSPPLVEIRWSSKGCAPIYGRCDGPGGSARVLAGYRRSDPSRHSMAHDFLGELRLAFSFGNRPRWRSHFSRQRSARLEWISSLCIALHLLGSCHRPLHWSAGIFSHRSLYHVPILRHCLVVIPKDACWKLFRQH
jgi:hypothetical protein